MTLLEVMLIATPATGCVATLIGFYLLWQMKHPKPPKHYTIEETP